jgi:hypothetical protein
VPNILYPRNPSRILTTAFKMGMAITIALARDRATGNSRLLYIGQGNRIKGMAKVWSTAKEEYQQTVRYGSPDATPLLKAENNIRRNFTRILLKTSVRYGNIETKRVKREEGVKKYLNIIWDYTGGRLRDVTKGRYFFSKPVPVEMEDGKKTDGYHGSSKTPFYPVRHNHLPELDFADMIRSPLMEISRQCLKYGVPIKDAKRYVNMLLLRLLPFLDYVYSERKSGRPNYVREGLRELRTVVELIKNEYGTRNGKRLSITTEVMQSIIEDDFIGIEEIEEDQDEEIEETTEGHILQDLVDRAKRDGAILDKSLLALYKLLENGTLDEEDSMDLLREYQEQSRKLGIKIHRFVSKNFQSPFSFDGIVYHGTEMAYDNSGLILLSDIPVDDGRGRLDFLLACAKKQTRVDGAFSTVICEPFMIVDLKTKSAFDFDIYGTESRSKDKETVVREFVLNHREMTSAEWKSALSATPDKYETGQLDAYEQAVLADYQRIMWKNIDSQESLAKAVLIVDSCQNWREISEAILPLVLRAYQGCIDGTLSAGDFLISSKGQNELRIAMRMLAVIRPNTGNEELDIPLPQKPFKYRIEDQKEFKLYLTVSGTGSASQSAASIAERWHGLEYIHSLARKRHRDVYWLDLVGEYTDPVLRNKQFRIKYQDKSIKRFFRERVLMRDLSEQVQSFVYEGASISFIRTWLQSQLSESRNPLIVISGWESLRQSTPESHKMYLDEIVTLLIHVAPVKSTIVWFARPVPIAQNSIAYSTRCVAPFYQDSVWQNIVDTIIWNVPMPPDRSGTRVSTNYHERGIIIERPEKSPEWKIIEIAPLQGWGQDFQSGGRTSPHIGHRIGGGFIHHRSWYGMKQLEQTMELIPHMLPHQEYNPAPRSDFDLEIKEISTGYSIRQDAIPRLIFNPTQIQKELEKDGRVRPLLPIADINRRREIREIQLAVPQQRRTTRPPSEYYLTDYELDYRKIALTEIRHLIGTIKFLKQDTVVNLSVLLDRIERVLTEVHPEDTTALLSTLRLVRQTLETNILSKQVWKRSLPYRSISGELSMTQKEHMTTMQMKHPDITLLVGNHLFLLILAAIGNNPEVVFPQTLASLWTYVRPWQLIGLGMKPVYPKAHTTGNSVLDRHRLLDRLRKRVVEKNWALDRQMSLTKIRFGQMIVLPSSGASDSILLWLLFQRSPGINAMNVALLNPRGIDPTLSPRGILQEMVSGRTLWSESDLNLLSLHARLHGDETRIRILIAEQYGEQILWIDEREKGRWIPIGRLHYTTRKFEDVTLVRTLELSEIHYLQPIEYDEVRQPHQRIDDLVLMATFILDKGLEKCVPATCNVSLDRDKKTYKVVFTNRTTQNLIGELLINRTVDLLEILRRPDDECEPVMVNGQRLIWNRFNGVSYNEDVAVLKSWVARYDPYPRMSLGLPPTAQDLLNTLKEYDITLELYHDPWTCPLKHISLEHIKKQHNLAKIAPHHYLFRSGNSYGEPFHVSNEPSMKHGSCWRINIDTPFKLSSELQEVMETRFTDAQVRTLLESREIIYWSKEKQEWVTHTFELVIKQDCIEEIKESWHLRTMIAQVLGQKYDAHLPGVYLQNPDRFSPYIIIEPEYVTIGLREKSTGQTTEKRINEQNVALRHRFEVQELLESELTDFLLELGIEVNRNLESELKGAIDSAIEIYGVKEDKAQVEFDYVTIDQDAIGGKVLYVVLTSELETHKVPVTKHLHDIRQLGHIRREHFVDEVKSLLTEFNLSDDDMDKVVKECVRKMRSENLIK